MCGIVGIWNHASGRPIDRRLFDAVTDALAHRGPDGRGTWHEGPLALGHRRLAILDPTPAGAQPMRHPTRPFVVTFNGEIYNFRELRRELLGHGHAFHTDCDTEVLLAAYARWGAEAAVRLRGMFAFALWDGERRELRLVRDRLGIKPLYYSLAGGVVRFASEVRGIIGDPSFPRTPSPDGIASLLALGYIPAPRTAWEGIRQLPPGHEVVIAADRPLESAVERPYWRLDPAPAARRAAVSNRDEDADAEFAARWARTVASHLVSDVPVGAFLSGGVDSAAVAAEMSRQRGGNAATFSVGFTERTFDESALAAETARRAGTRHHAVRLDLDLAQTFDSVAASADEPFADSSALAVWHLCRETSRHVKVALSGDGADELLGGYSTYRATWLAGAYRRLPAAVRAALRWGGARLPAADSRYNLPQFAQRVVYGAEQPAGRDFASWRIHLADAARDAVLRPDWRAAAFDPLRPYAAAFGEAPANATLLQRMLHADLTF
jgi:asparagine synthase (glutamine-hydrolysing)